MTYRPRLEYRVLRQMKGLPEEALDSLVRVLSRICDDPRDRLLSVPVPEGGRERVAELGDCGFIVFVIEDDAGLIRVVDLVWTC